MKKVLAGAVVASALGTMFVAGPADAASGTRFCNSSRSDGNVRVGATDVRPGFCLTASAHSTVRVSGRSYRVAYNGSGIYGTCRTSPAYTGSTAATAVSFTVYRLSYCQH